jgi:hypothetical protein
MAETLDVLAEGTDEAELIQRERPKVIDQIPDLPDVPGESVSDLTQVGLNSFGRSPHNRPGDPQPVDDGGERGSEVIVKLAGDASPLLLLRQGNLRNPFFERSIAFRGEGSFPRLL